MRLRSVVLGIAIAALSSLTTWQWASAQAARALPAIVGGLDIAFRPDREQRSGIMGESLVRGKLYVRINGQWLAAELTGGDAEAHLRPLRP